MTKQLYYDDPLIAAYMMREFDITVISHDISVPESDRHYNWNICNINGNPERDAIAYFANLAVDGRVYIHPDSFDIFEPQIGDMISKCYEYDAGNGVVNEKHNIFITRRAEELEFWEGRQIDELIIIQRNGKQFFMPKEQ